jgi:hypothetical protein
LGGGNADEWNRRLNDLAINALPIAHSKNKEAITTAAVAVCRGTMDMAPADPVEGILIAQLMAANEAALAMYSKGGHSQLSISRRGRNTCSLPTRRHGRS